MKEVILNLLLIVALLSAGAGAIYLVADAKVQGDEIRASREFCEQAKKRGVYAPGCESNSKK